MTLLGQFIYYLLDIYIFIIIATVIVSWLIAFNVISMGNPTARRLVDLLGKMTDPVMRSVQRYIPSIGGIDISPIIIIFAIMFLQRLVVQFLIYPGMAV
jgi:YggT family protein